MQTAQNIQYRAARRDVISCETLIAIPYFENTGLFFFVDDEEEKITLS